MLYFLDEGAGKIEAAQSIAAGLGAAHALGVEGLK